MASSYHFLDLPQTQLVRAWHVDPNDGHLIKDELGEVDFVRNIKMRIGFDIALPIIGIEYAGIQPTGGQIALFYHNSGSWSFAPVDSGSLGQIDVAVSSTSMQYVAYMKSQQNAANTIVCLASRPLPELGVRPFQVDTLIRAGHLGNDQPIKVQLFLDSQERPVVLTSVASASSQSLDRIYESVQRTAVLDVPVGRRIDAPPAVLYARPAPVRLNGVLTIDLESAFSQLSIIDAVGRRLSILPATAGRHIALPAREIFPSPGIYFVIADGTKFGRVNRRVVVTE
jgi:hypothetical protein